MTLILHFWQRMWQSVAFDTACGLGRIRWLRRVPARVQGWAFKHAGRWYAVWNGGASLVFQVGEKQLPMTEAFECSNVRAGRTRRFSVTRDGILVLEVTYGAVDRDGDPAFDDAELEQADFFVWATRLWNDAKWKEDVVRNWTAAPEAGHR
jgi:hypothetical protein